MNSQETESQYLVAEAIFGEEVGQNLQHLDVLIGNLSGTQYSFMSDQEYRAVALEDVAEANRIYWHEILQRSHLAAATSLLRGRQWIDGMLASWSSGNLLSFAACTRGLVESAADSLTALNVVPPTLAQAYSTVTEALGRDLTDGIHANRELEDTLIHYSHARKPQKSENAPSSHRAKTIKDYLSILEEAELKNIGALYSELCDLTHPGASSVAIWFRFPTSQSFELSTSTGHLLENLLPEETRSTLKETYQVVMNGPIITLVVLNYFGAAELHTPILTAMSLDGVPAWAKIKAGPLRDKHPLVSEWGDSRSAPS